MHKEGLVEIKCNSQNATLYQIINVYHEKMDNSRSVHIIMEVRHINKTEYDKGTKYRLLRIYRLLDFTDISEISVKYRLIF